MSDVSIGKLVEGEAHRDAIHIAIAPVVAAQKLSPGQEIGFVEPGNTVMVGRSDNPIGIVDPFLTGRIFPDDQFYMFLFPNTVTGMRHHWAHPAFGATDYSPDKATSMEWLEDYAREFEMTAESVIAAAREFLKHGTYHRLKFDTPDRAYGDRELFWRHYEIATGEKVNEADRESQIFTCSC